jgi:hypothetical protein
MRERPALWVPMMAAGLLNFAVSTLLMIMMRKSALPFLMTGAPRLGSQPPLENLVALALLFVFMVIASFYASYLRVPAFFATAKMAVLMKRHPEVSGRDAIQLVHVDRTQTFWFAAQIAAFEIVRFIILQVIFHLINHHNRTSVSILFSAPFMLGGFAYSLGMAYVLTPSALRLLRPLDAPAMEPQRLWQARSFALQCVAVASALSIVFSMLDRHVITHRPLFHALSALAVVLKTVLYIGLAVVMGDVAWSDAAAASGDLKESQDDSPPTYNS